MTISANDFAEAPCRRCGNLRPTQWDVASKRWVFDGSCNQCESLHAREARKTLSLKASGLTEEEAKLTLDNVHVTEENHEAYEACIRLSKGEPLNLFLSGAAGRGKSRLAIGVIIARLGSRVRFLPVTRALMEIRSNLRETSEDSYIERLLSYDVLVMDDFGANKLTDWNLSFTDCLIDEWYRRRKKGLIVTSNFSLREISEKISDRIASRLAQICEVYELKGKDWRLN